MIRYFGPEVYKQTGNLSDLFSMVELARGAALFCKLDPKIQNKLISEWKSMVKRNDKK